MSPNVSRRVFISHHLLALAAAALLFVEKGLAQDSHPESKDKSTKDSKDSKDTKDEKVVYDPGGDVKPPKLVHYVEPDFSPNSKEAYVEGTVKISTIVNTDGVATEPHIVAGLNAAEDRTAIEALKQWKFQPGTKSGQPVNVRVTVEVSFHLL